MITQKVLFHTALHNQLTAFSAVLTADREQERRVRLHREAEKLQDRIDRAYDAGNNKKAKELNRELLEVRIMLHKM